MQLDIALTYEILSTANAVDSLGPATNQYPLAFEALREVLEWHCLGPGDIVELTSYHVGYPQHMAEFSGAKAAFPGDARPAWTAIGVAAPGHPETLVEVKAIARCAR